MIKELGARFKSCPDRQETKALEAWQATEGTILLSGLTTRIPVLHCRRRKFAVFQQHVKFILVKKAALIKGRT